MINTCKRINNTNRQKLTDDGYLSVTNPPMTPVMQQFDMIHTLLSDEVRKMIVKAPYVNTEILSTPRGFISYGKKYLIHFGSKI